MLDVIASGCWAEPRDDELRAHVAACSECSETAVVAAALLEDRLESQREAPVPRSGVVWWRIQIRSRRDEECRAARAVSATHATIVVGASGIALATLVGAVPADSLAWASGLAGSVRAAALGTWGLPWLLAAAAWLVLAPLAVWLAVTEE